VVAALLTAGLSAAVGSTEWFRLQTLKVKPLCISIVVGVLAAMAVILWMHVLEVATAQLLFQLPQNLSPLELAGMILCFAFFNSFAEEFIFRGLALRALVSKSAWRGNVIQAVAFGLLHFKGLPFGFSGSLMAVVFALFMGGLRQKTKSFVYPWVSHFTANVGMAMGLYYFTTAMQ
jgi:membrane protease YdiL (CAAX protease family)